MVDTPIDAIEQVARMLWPDVIDFACVRNEKEADELTTDELKEAVVLVMLSKLEQQKPPL